MLQPRHYSASWPRRQILLYHCHSCQLADCGQQIPMPHIYCMMKEPELCSVPQQVHSCLNAVSDRPVPSNLQVKESELMLEQQHSYVNLKERGNIEDLYTDRIT